VDASWSVAVVSAASDAAGLASSVVLLLLEPQAVANDRIIASPSPKAISFFIVTLPFLFDLTFPSFFVVRFAMPFTLHNLP
jgi:hypothetical protein